MRVSDVDWGGDVRAWSWRANLLPRRKSLCFFSCSRGGTHTFVHNKLVLIWATLVASNIHNPAIFSLPALPLSQHPTDSLHKSRAAPDRGRQGLGGGAGGGIAGRGHGLGGGLPGFDDASVVGSSDAGSNNHRSRSLSPRSRPPLRGAGIAGSALEAGTPEASVAGRDRGPTLGIHRAGLGAHLLLPAVSVGAAWLVDLFIRFLENRVEYTAKHHIISGE